MTRVRYPWDVNGTGELKETRAYNVLGQMTQLAVVRPEATWTFDYHFPETANNGRIDWSRDSRIGEKVVYQYDELNRLERAEVEGGSAGGVWGTIFSFDGFGNMDAQEQVPGKGGPAWSVLINRNSNRLSGYQIAYDANGNLESYPGAGGVQNLSYDGRNRLGSVAVSGAGTEYYGYAPGGSRVWKRTVRNETQTRFFFRGVGGRVLEEYERDDAEVTGFAVRRRHVYFGGKRLAQGEVGAGGWMTWRSVVTDRVGSVVGVGSQANYYYPYQERSAPEDDQGKFGTYYRDDFTKLDYAQQRYYQGQFGRFLTADPYRASGGSADPGSWNRYAYVEGDPVNFVDPAGLFLSREPTTGPLHDPCMRSEPFRKMHPGMCGGGGGGGGPRAPDVYKPRGGGQGTRGTSKWGEARDPCHDRNLAAVEVAGIAVDSSSLDLGINGGLRWQVLPSVADKLKATLAGNEGWIQGSAISVAYHYGDVGGHFGDGTTEFRSTIPGPAGDRSAQIVIRGTRNKEGNIWIYADTDRFSSLQDVVNFVGHMSLEVIRSWFGGNRSCEGVAGSRYAP